MPSRNSLKLQVRRLVLVPLVQLPVPLVLGGLGRGSPTGPGTPKTEVHQGSSFEVHEVIYFSINLA
jgi:hypothetical protein